MNKTILTGIDELTVILFPHKSEIATPEDWLEKAESMIDEFARLACLEQNFGEKTNLEDKCPQGYSVGRTFGHNPFYFAMAYHPSHPQMGVIVKFSAYSWYSYCSRGNMNVKKFLRTVQSDAYRCRLSRIDFAVDYQNWDITVDGIYQNLINGNLEIYNSDGRKNCSKISALEVDGVADTFYVGSKKTGTRLFLRVYDKRTEQIQNRGFRFAEALGTDTWVRFEVVFKGDYAHQLTNIILNTKEENLQDLIADKMVEKYRVYCVEEKKYADYTTALIEKTRLQFTKLLLKSPRDNDLIRSLLHLITGAGLFSSLYKCDEIWGDETSKKLLQHLHNIYKKYYKPNEDVLLWLKKHKNAMEKQSLQEDIELLTEMKFGGADETKNLPKQKIA